jgi:hypothetical protein
MAIVEDDNPIGREAQIMIPRYKGAGSTDEAANFECAGNS